MENGVIQTKKKMRLGGYKFATMKLLKMGLMFYPKNTTRGVRIITQK